METLIIKRRGLLRDQWYHGLCALFFTFLSFSILFVSHDVAELATFTGVLFVISLAFWVVLIRRIFAGSACFDPAAGVVTFKKIFSRPRKFSFSEIAGIAPMTSKYIFLPFLTREGYCAVLRGDPVFGAIPLSTFFPKKSAKLRHFRESTLPRLEAMLRESGEAPPVDAAPLDSVGYTKIGGRYIKSRVKNCFILLFVSVLPLLIMGAYFRHRFAYDHDVIRAIIAAAASAVFGVVFTGFFAPRSIAVDPTRRTVELEKGLIAGRIKTYPFSSVLSLEVTSFQGNFLFSNMRDLSIRFEGVKRPCEISRGWRRSRASMNAELFSLLALFGEDSAGKISYTERRT